MNAVGLQKVAEIIEQMRLFVDQVYVPDTLAIASFYKDWFKPGHGEGTGNFMTYGDFPANGKPDPKSLLVPRGAILKSRPVPCDEEVDLNAEGGHPGVRRAFLVRLQRRQGCRPASLPRARRS